MWGFLVLISGGFFYTVGTVMNAKATPNPTVVRYQAQAESMFVWHNIAKKESQNPTNSSVNSFYYTSFPSYGFTDSTWAAIKVPANSNCVLTYKKVGVQLSNAKYVTASLAKYVTPGRSVGFIDASGAVTASSDAATIGTSLFASANATDTPYIYECW